MGIQSSINSALGTLRVLGVLNSGKKYIDQQVQKGTKTVDKAVGEVKDTVKESTKGIKSSMDSGAQAVKNAADKIEKNFLTWTDRYGNVIIGEKPNYDPEKVKMADKYRSEFERAKSAQQRLFDKLKSKMAARDSVNNMKDILKGDISINRINGAVGDSYEVYSGLEEEKNLNGGAN